MTWEYRVMRPTSQLGETEVVIIEAFYGEGEESEKIVGYTSADPAGETVDELRKTLELMLKALDKPVINEWDL